MSIIYSYPTVQPAADDLLIGTDVGSDNATKSFTISSVASLVGEIASAGTVNSVQIATDAFLSAVGGPITSSGTITIGLTALGTPSTNTFLRGDNRWVTPTVSAGIYAFNQNTQITDDISSINFRGEGVTATSSADGSVTVQIDGGQAGVESVTGGTGITVNQTSGDVEITNTGVTRLTAGSNITLSAQTGDITISSSSGTSGVSIVNAGTGLTIESGTAQANPTIGVDYIGINNFIRLGENPEVATASDFMLFEDVTTGDVKSTTLGTIPTSAFSLVEASINTVDTNAVKHNTDIYPSIPTVFQVITLTQAEYNAIATKNGNTLYLIGGGVTQITKTLAITNNINGTEYTIGGDQAGLPKIGAQGSAYNFTTTVTANPGFEFSEPLVIQNAQGVYDTNGTVYTIISGTVAAIDPGTCTANLIIDASGLVTQDGAVENTVYEITSTTNTISGTCGTSFTSSNFGVAVSLVAGQNTDQWEIINPVYTYSPASGTLNGSTPVTCTVTGTVREKSYTLQYNITDSNTGGVYATDYTILNSNLSGTSFDGGIAPLTQTISGKFSNPYDIATTFSNVSGSNNNTVIGSASLGTVNGNVISGITGTLGASAPSGVILNQTIASTTSAIAGPAQFQLTALNQNVQAVDDGDSVQNKGFTYADYVQYRINNGPLNNITTLNQYILVSEGDVVTLSYAEPTVTPDSGFFVKTPFGTSINITDGTNNFVNSFTAVADASYNITVTQTGGVTNRRNAQGRSVSFVANESEACDLTMAPTFNYYLSKPSNPTAPATPWLPEVNDYTWSTDYGYNSFADGWYRANLTVTFGGTPPTNPGKYQLLSNRVNVASACPAEGTAILSVDDQVNGSSSSYTISSTYTVTPSGGSPGSSIPYTNTPVTAIAGSTIIFVTTIVADSGFYFSSGPTVTPAGNNSVTITADSQVQANVTVQGTTASLIQIRTTSASLDASGACGDDTDAQDAWKTGNSTTPIAGQILYGDPTRLNFADPGFYVIFGQTQSFEVNSSGVISNVQNC